MQIEIVRSITNSPKRKFLFHFTRVDNLRSIAIADGLYASDAIHPNPEGKRRKVKEAYKFRGNSAFLNAHLQISKEMMDRDTSIDQFRAFLDQNVFLWPTIRFCQQMLQMYARREPCEKFAVLQMDAYALLADYYDRVCLSKYDAGSMPRYPKRTSYRKTLRMFLPLDAFRQREDALVPRIPSEIHEILIHTSVPTLHCYLQAVYCTDITDLPERWGHLYRPLKDIYVEK